MRTGLKIGRTAEQAIAILEHLKRGETVRYASPDGIWDFTSKKLPEPKRTEPARIWCFNEAITRKKEMEHPKDCDCIFCQGGPKN